MGTNLPNIHLGWTAADLMATAPVTAAPPGLLHLQRTSLSKQRTVSA